MPQRYSVPIWYSDQYNERMILVLQRLRETFQPVYSVKEVLMAIWQTTPHAYRRKRAVWKVHDRFVWHGQDFNVGYMQLFSASPEIYRHLFPSAAEASIEVRPSSPSPAEDGVLPYALAESLSPRHQGMARIAALSAAMTTEERHVVLDVLGLMALRNDEVSGVSAEAIQEFWQFEEPDGGHIC